MAAPGTSSIPVAAIASPIPSNSTSTLRFGLNRNAPAYIFGVGYSFRLDGLFKSAR